MLAGAVALVMALEAALLTGVLVPGDLVVQFAASTATTPIRFVVLWAAVAPICRRKQPCQSQGLPLEGRCRRPAWPGG